MVSWALRRLGLPLPLIAASDVFLNVALVAGLFRASGAFFVRRGGARRTDPLWAAVLEAYAQELLKRNAWIEVSAENATLQ